VLGNLFAILVAPGRTLDRLLEERSNRQSWAATWFLIVLNAFVLFFLGIWAFREFTQILELGGVKEEILPISAFGVVFAVIMFFTVGYIVLDYVLSRYVFAWLVQLGLRISASDEYPSDLTERAEKGMLLRLIQPYTAWIVMLPGLVGLILIPFLFDFSILADLFEDGAIYDEPTPEMMRLMFGGMLYWMVCALIGFVAYLYMVVVRVMGIMKIYQISAGKAFWGPFLVFVIVYFVLWGIQFVLSWLPMMFSDGLMGPGTF
jgi:hypothetical protein